MELVGPCSLNVTEKTIRCAEIRAFANREHMSLVQKPAPEVDQIALFPDGSFKQFKLADYRGKYVVLFFYPLDFTFVCPTEILAFSDRYPEFKAIDCELACCSTDSHFTHLAWTKVERSKGGIGQISIPMISDITHKVASDYGVHVTEGDDAGVSLRGLFIIDPKGTVRQVTINDLPVGRSVDETLRLVQAFQFHDKHGDVCPANWKPGADTIKPDPEGSQAFFSKQDPDASAGKRKRT